MNIISFLEGKKVYILAICMGLIAAAEYLGWLPQNTATVLLGLLGAGGVAGSRMATAKVSKSLAK